MLILKMLLLATIVAGAGCSQAADPQDPADMGGVDDMGADDEGADDADAADAEDTALPSRCIAAPTPWAAGTPIFSEQTEASGLLELNAEAQHIGAVDWNGDGLADLVLRRDSTTGLTWDDWAAGTRAFWLLENQGDGTFVDRTRESGIVESREDPNLGRPSEIAVFADVDNDGDLDAFTAYRSTGSRPDGAEVMLNDGAGGFTFGDVGFQIHKAGLPWPAYGASFVDHNRDGRIDLWVAYFANVSDVLYEQQEAGTFADRSSLYGIIEDSTPEARNEGRAPTSGWGATACDLNGDGQPELMSTSYGRSPNHLWLAGLADGVPTYENVSVESGYAFDDRTDWSDDESARCWCMLHPDDEDCAGVPPPDVFPCSVDADALRWNHFTSREPSSLGGNSATTICADLDGDGDMDLLNTELRHWDVGSASDPTEILVNDGALRPSFSRPGRAAMGLERVQEATYWDEGDLDAAVFDFDNDGRPDIWINSSDYAGTRAHLYRQVSAGQYQEVALGDFVDLTRAKGIGIADFDRDGDLDVVASRSDVRCDDPVECVDFHARYFDNVVGNGNNWVQLRLEGGAGTNRSAIGARVTVDNGDVMQVQEVGGGHGRLGIQHELALHFGLGTACEATVTVRWPNEALTEQTFTLDAGHRWALVEDGTPVLDPLGP